jgi:hypothetical protein
MASLKKKTHCIFIYQRASTFNLYRVINDCLIAVGVEIMQILDVPAASQHETD